MIGLISINYKNAPLEVREKFDFSPTQTFDFYNKIVEKNIVEGLMILSTCNRTEIFFEGKTQLGKENNLIHNVTKELVNYKSFHESLSPYVEIKTKQYVK